MPENKNIRLLAAIMFADMVGYTKLMQDDENNAITLRDRQRSVVDKYILKYRGTVMQYYGDGTLSMFGSALDAVNCAKEIQLELLQEPKIPLRIGIHIGDVVYDDDGIYGDAVNISARVQSLGIPGAVMISGKVFDEVKNHPGIKVLGLGDFELKNVYNPVGIFALANDGLSVPDQNYIQTINGSNKNSIAVLPFANFSANKNDEYFSDGITEEIINALVKVKGLRVTSRTSVFAYKNTQKDIRQIGKELNVSAVLEGSVRLAGNRVRVTAQLINTEDGFHSWSENFDFEMKDIFGVQDEISRKIAEKVKNNNLDASEKLYEASTDSVVAYNYYLQGLFYWNKRTPEAVLKAIDYFSKAIDKCSTYTNAYSYIANCYSFLGAIGHMLGKDAFVKAEEFALKAIELNRTRGDSYIALGYVNLLSRWDFVHAESNFRKAITIEPDNEEARLAYSFYNRIIGRYDKMLDQAKAAVKMAPLSLPALIELARAEWVVGNNKEAIKLFDKVLELDPSFRAANEGKAMVYACNREFDKALAQVKKYLKQVKGPFKGGSQLGAVAAMMGDTEEAYRQIELIKQREDSQPNLNLSLDFAFVYAALGDYDTAFEYLNKAVDERLGSVLLINSMPIINNLKNDSRFELVLKRIGLPKEVLVA